MTYLVDANVLSESTKARPDSKVVAWLTAHEGDFVVDPSCSANSRSDERKILKLIGEGKSSKEIADLLFVNYRTVENHRTNICDKLELHGSHARLKFALQNKSDL